MSTFEDRYKDTVGAYKSATTEQDRERLGKQVREATLERADRREWAHKRKGDERRFNE